MTLPLHKVPSVNQPHNSKGITARQANPPSIPLAASQKCLPVPQRDTDAANLRQFETTEHFDHQGQHKPLWPICSPPLPVDHKLDTTAFAPAYIIPRPWQDAQRPRRASGASRNHMQTPMERWMGETVTDQPWQDLAEVHVRYGKDPSDNTPRYPRTSS
ncbi:MAG: hypothetical protein M1813_001713 [Trichoglossum hirsutum]|nr:MAG: hypothetical protein M1813_001713 [Trichoglossum hirsutum]